MSSVYATEPATSGRVVFETTHGPLQIDLWCRECPRTTKLFLQLCCDGFYDNALFHRIVPNFLIQTGAVRLRENNVEPIAWHAETQTGGTYNYREKVQADVALERRKHEWNSRIQFNHRGQVAMALEIDQDDDENCTLQPQFFITLEEAEYLDKKHLIFGTITGPTLFNAIRIGQVHIDDDRMQESPRITSVGIVENQIHTDIAPLLQVPWQQRVAAAKENDIKKKKKRKGKLDTNVLSFGDELEDGEEGLHIVAQHNWKKSKKADKKKNAENQKKADSVSNHEEQETARIEKPISTEESSSMAVATPHASLAEHITSSDGGNKIEELRDQNIDKVGPVARQQQKQEESSRMTSIVEARKAKYGNTRKTKRDREDDTLAKLQAFQSKVKKLLHTSGESCQSKANRLQEDNSLAARMARRAGMHVEEENAKGDDKGLEAPIYHGQILEDDDHEEEQTSQVASSSWMKTTFKCRRHVDLLHSDLGGDGRDADDYKVIDDRHKSKREEKHHRTKGRHDREKNDKRYGSDRRYQK